MDNKRPNQGDVLELYATDTKAMTPERRALIDELNAYLNFRLAHRILGLGAAQGWDLQQYYGAICELEIILAEFGLEPSDEVVALRERLPGARQMHIDDEDGD